jgi:prevent-host-death family protein
MTMKKKSRDKVVPAGEFKAKCLAIFDEVEVRRHTFVITKRGRPVARIVPLATDASGSLRGSLLREEGLLDPIDVEWDAGG